MLFELSLDCHAIDASSLNMLLYYHKISKYFKQLARKSYQNKREIITGNRPTPSGNLLPVPRHYHKQ